MDHEHTYQRDGIDPDEWENISYSDLAHLNRYARDKLLGSKQPIDFVALNMHWAEPIGPSIPDGRYVNLLLILRKFITYFT